MRMVYLAIKKLPALLTGITSKNQGEFYCLNNLHSLATGKKECKSYNVTLQCFLKTLKY